MAAPPNNVMIIHIGVNCKDYQGFVDEYKGGEASRGRLRCKDPECGCDKFYRHGFYSRYLLTPSDDILDMDPDPAMECLSRLFAGDPQMFSVLRVKCCGCGATHAVLPADAWPFHAASLPLVLVLLLNVCQEQLPAPIEEAALPSRVPGITWQLLSYYLRVYLSYRLRMAAALRQSGLYHCALPPSDSRLLRAYLFFSHPPDVYSRFFEYFGTPLFMARRSTGKYPLRFILWDPA